MVLSAGMAGISSFRAHTMVSGLPKQDRPTRREHILAHGESIRRLIARPPGSRRSAVNLDSFESVSLGTLVERLGRLSDERMRQVCGALEVAVACEA